MFGFFRRKKKVVESKKIGAPNMARAVGAESREPAAAVKPEPNYVRNTKIEYQPQLIEQFKKDHQVLLTIFTNIVEKSNLDDTSEVPALLSEFKRRIIGHLLQENIQLYVYLKYLYADDSLTAELTKNMQKEMPGIGKTVLDFITCYTQKNACFGQEFKDGLNAIGAVLVERIRLEEENLYGLYMDPSSTF